MNFTSQARRNPATGEDERYYRLSESYRDASGRPCSRPLLTVGFIHDLKPEEIRDVARGLTYKYDNQDRQELWDDKLCCYSDTVRCKIDELWSRLVAEEKLDLVHKAVVGRIARLEGRYPSIARYYSISVEKDDKGKASSVTWAVEMPDEEVFGTYFLRTNVKTLDEKTAWDYYNLIREIECSNRQLKTDLNLRPIYHRKDERSDAHRYPPRDTR